MADLPLWRYPRILMTACQMSDQAWAQVLGLPVAEAGAWLDNETEMARPSNARLVLLHNLITCLGRSYSGAGIGSWMTSPQPELELMRPVDWIGAERDPERLVLTARREAARCHGVTTGSAYWPR